MAEETESAHGQLVPVDKAWNGPRFIVVLVATLLFAFAVLWAIGAWKHGDWAWQPFAHDLVEHTFHPLP